MAELKTDWTEIYRDAVRPAFVYDRAKVMTDPEYEGEHRTCRIIPCPGSYFPAHDEQCEMSWDEDEYTYTDCQCEPRARAVRDSHV